MMKELRLTNPDFYKKIGDTFKQKYPNTLAWMISSDLEGVKNVGLRPSRKIKLFNGKLECRFYAIRNVRRHEEDS